MLLVDFINKHYSLFLSRSLLLVTELLCLWYCHSMFLLNLSTGMKTLRFFNKQTITGKKRKKSCKGSLYGATMSLVQVRLSLSKSSELPNMK